MAVMSFPYRRLAAAMLLCVACGGAAGETVVVSAAASLTDAFGAMAAAFEAEHPEYELVLNVAASSTLREQVAEGAPVDVIASADHASIEPVTDLLGVVRSFAVNRLAIAVPPGNPAAITGLADFERADLLLGICVEAAPCGSLARDAFAMAGVTAEVDSEEPNVRALLIKVAEGELDAGVVYVTDVAAPGSGVDGVGVPGGPVTEYPIAVVVDSPNPTGAQAFVAFVHSVEGQAILAEYGFGSP